jgi:hypothetical protein
LKKVNFEKIKVSCGGGFFGIKYQSNIAFFFENKSLIGHIKAGTSGGGEQEESFIL